MSATARARRGTKCASWALALIACCAVLGCDQREEQEQQAGEARVLLGGPFERISKSATGRVELVRRGADYELLLDGVALQGNTPAHVYLVGAERVSNTRDVDAAELKYDMGPLEPGGMVQHIALPSQPDPRLRSVVLYNPKYSASLAAASLRPTLPR